MGTDPPLNSPLVTAIVVISHNEAYATANTGQVIRWDGVLWRATATLPPDAGDLQAITSDLSVTPPVIFVAAERHVYVTADRGATWQGASNGLPAAVLCSDIRWVQDNDGARVYLSTYGRSVWVAEQTVGK